MREYKFGSASRIMMRITLTMFILGSPTQQYCQYVAWKAFQALHERAWAERMVRAISAALEPCSPHHKLQEGCRAGGIRSDLRNRHPRFQ